MKRVGKPYWIEKPTYTGENWRVVVVDGALVTNHGFQTKLKALKFIKDNKEDSQNAH